MLKLCSFIYLKLLRRNRETTNNQIGSSYITFCTLIMMLLVASCLLAGALGFVKLIANMHFIAIITVFILSPYVLVYIVYRVNKKQIQLFWDGFKNSSPHEKRKLNRKYKITVLTIIAFFFFSLIFTSLKSHYDRLS